MTPYDRMRARHMRCALLLVATLPCAAFAQTQTQFRPPGGLPLSTQVGTARNSDGSASVTLGSMQNGIETNSRNIAALQASGVSHDALAAALAPYRTQAAADAEYATQTALSAEESRARAAEQANASAISDIQSSGATKDDLTAALATHATQSALSEESARAKDAEQANASAIASLQSDSVTKGDLSSSLAPYITRSAADGRYATPSAVSGAVQSEADRARAAEQKNAGDIAAIQSGYVSGPALSSSLAPYLTQSQAAQTYLPLSGGTVRTLDVGSTFSPPNTTYAEATASSCTEGTLAYVRDAQKFGTAAAAGTAPSNSPVYSFTGGASWGGALFLCTRLGGSPAWVALVFNQYVGPAQK